MPIDNANQMWYAVNAKGGVMLVRWKNRNGVEKKVEIDQCHAFSNEKYNGFCISCLERMASVTILSFLKKMEASLEKVNILITTKIKGS